MRWRAIWRDTLQYLFGGVVYLGCATVSLLVFTLCAVGWLVLAVRAYQYLMRVTE